MNFRLRGSLLVVPSFQFAKGFYICVDIDAFLCSYFFFFYEFSVKKLTQLFAGDVRWRFRSDAKHQFIE